MYKRQGKHRVISVVRFVISAVSGENSIGKMAAYFAVGNEIESTEESQACVTGNLLMRVRGGVRRRHLNRTVNG